MKAVELTDKLLKRFEIQRKKLFHSTKLKHSNPKLNTLHYTETGHLEVTNSYSAIRLYDCHNGEEKKVPHVEGTYPDMDRIFAGKEGYDSVELDVKRMEDVLYPCTKLTDKTIIMNFTNSGVLIEPVEHTEVLDKAHLKSELNIEKPHHVGVNAKYLHDCFNFFRLAKIEKVTMYYSSEVRPMHFIYENLHYLVTPVRTGRDLELKK